MRRKLNPNPYPDLQPGDVLLLSAPKWPYANGAKETFRVTVLAIRAPRGVALIECCLAVREHVISVLPEWADEVQRKREHGRRAA